MKHVACGGVIEIRTDPQNTAYVVTEGARKRDLGEDKVAEGDVKILTEDEREKLRANAFAALEGKVEDKQRLEHAKKRIEELQELSSQQWEDPYERNKKLRNAFREGRKTREKEAGVTAALQDKMSLGIDLLPEHEDDKRRAGFIEFGGLDQKRAMSKAISKPLFSPGEVPKEGKNSKTSKKRKAEDLARRKTADAIAEIRGNTRAAMDPFLSNAPKAAPKSLLVGVKRKRSVEQEASANQSGPILVDYDSD
jgi:coiled-coil domain-containing protein 130